MENTPSFIASLQKLGLAESIRGIIWAYPLIEILHIAGLLLVFGSILILNLRLMGLALKSESPKQMALGLAPLMWVGLVIQFISGPLLFITSSAKFYASGAFRLKLTALIVALIFHFTVVRKQALRDDFQQGSARVVGAVSMLIWLVVVFAGFAIELVADLLEGLFA
jgi:hypothetical protein